MRYLRPIPRRLLPDQMLVYPDRGDGTFGRPVLVRHVLLQLEEQAVDDGHRSVACAGRVYVDAVNSEGAFEVPAGSKVIVGASPSMRVVRCRRCCVVRGQVHHWELWVS